MKQFINDAFVLENGVAKELYDTYSKDMPIIDFHNHLNPKCIAEDLSFDNLGQIWLEGDH